ncbi:hypothetical protein HPB52_022862 [Rhipicephalus sanguineus]|uniref:Uncharacterized protein n=1 Tax=Rhipicephalus sanguineus TaxID=34632 RepID=A0A9D4TC04_RHISA|nr:hypothetical protein HPB52_022862 [Rhipicephalus sanguineus]
MQTARDGSVTEEYKDGDLLEKWRRAIPRTARCPSADIFSLQKHFELELVYKEWTAHYKEHVSMKVPRQAALSKDAVPIKFPDCPAYLSNSSKRRPAERILPVPSKKSASSTGVSCQGSARNTDLHALHPLLYPATLRKKPVAGFSFPAADSSNDALVNLKMGNLNAGGFAIDNE